VSDGLYFIRKWSNSEQMINLNSQKRTATYCDIKFCNQVGGMAVPDSNPNYRLAIFIKIFLVFLSTSKQIQLL